MKFPRTAAEAQAMEAPACADCGNPNGREGIHYFIGFTRWICEPCYKKSVSLGKREPGLLPFAPRGAR